AGHAGRARRPFAPPPGVPQPRRQRHQAPPPQAGGPRARAREGRGAPLALRGGGRWARHRAALSRARLRHLPDPRGARQGGGHRHRSSPRQEDRRGRGRPGLARLGGRPRRDLLVHLAQRGETMKLQIDQGAAPSAAPDDRQTNILLVEDDEVDVMNVQRAFKKNNVANPLYLAGNGVDALETLRSGQMPANRRLVLLDLNMPRMGGIEFLRELRADPELRGTPVVVLTTSNDDRDRVEAYNLNVAGYILKPVTLANFI